MPSREISTAVEIALSWRVCRVHHLLVLEPALEPPREPARDRPQAVGADPNLEPHRVRHQSTHPAVAVEKRVNEVEPVMRGSHRDELVADAELRELILARE